ncbi:MAG: PorP/SprF family type IX secretion system membrane protein [Bacteroidota bacterium]
MVKDTLLSQFKSGIKAFQFALLVFVLSATNTHAQQLPIFTQYREHNSLLNPAAINSGYFNFEQNGVFGISHRSQWTDIPTAPKTTVLHGSYMTDDLSGINVLFGGNLINDQVGPTAFTGLNARFAGIISGDPAYNGISLGLSAGAVQYRVKADELRARDQNDISLAQNVAQIYPDVGIGIFAYQSFGRNDYVYGGVSVPQVIGLDLSFQDDNGREFTTKRIQHYYAQIGLIKTFRNESFLEPSVWVKYVQNSPVNVDFNVRYQFVEALWIGAGASTSKTAHLEGGVLLGDNVGYESNVQIGYGYDYSFSSQGPFLGGTHEFNLAYYFSR